MLNQIVRAFKDIDSCTVFAFDSAFIKYFSVALVSFIHFSDCSKRYDLIVLHTDVDFTSQEKLQAMCPNNVSLRFFNVSELIKTNFPDMVLKTYYIWSVSTYYRLLIPLICREYKTVLYLDSDVLIVDSIDDLLKQDSVASVACVPECMARAPELYKSNWNEFVQPLNLLYPEQYFNAGVMIFYPQNIDSEKFKSSVIETLKTQELKLLDQDCLNIVFNSNVKSLDCRYNLTVHTFPFVGGRASNDEYNNEIAAAVSRPAIIHFTTADKPWKSWRYPFVEKWWEMARKSPYYEDLCRDGNRTKVSVRLRYWLYLCMSLFSAEYRSKAENLKLRAYPNFH